MAWYEDASVVIRTGKPGNAHWTDEHKPGGPAPIAGIYKCTACKVEVTCPKGHRMPSTNDHEHEKGTPVRWRLIVRTNTGGT